MPTLTPRPYQWEGIQFLQSHKRALLLDEPGLGKTLQAAMASTPPVVVCCPTYLIEQWAAFLQEQFPSHRVVAATGNRARRETALAQPADWYVMNHEMLPTYGLPRHTTLILDESHHFKNRKAKQSQEAFIWASGAKYVYLLTATPIVKEVDDLWMQLHIIAPKLFASYWGFVEAFCTVQHTPWADKVVGIKNEDALRRLLAKYSIGRTYKDVQLELPPLIEQNVPVRLDPELLQEYKNIKRNYRIQGAPLQSAGEVLTVLRNFTAQGAKLDALVQLLEDQPAPAVVFCWYKESARLVAQALKTKAITGDVFASDRVKFAQQHPNRLVCTIASLTEGVDLSWARQVVFFEEAYVPNTQALARVWRHGQDNTTPVRVYYLLALNTIDVRVHNSAKIRHLTIEQLMQEELQDAEEL